MDKQLLLCRTALSLSSFNVNSGYTIEKAMKKHINCQIRLIPVNI